MIRMVILTALAPATAVALWHAPTALWAWAMLAALIGFSAGTLRWVRWRRQAIDAAADSRTEARRRRLARLTGRSDAFRTDSDPRP